MPRAKAAAGIEGGEGQTRAIFLIFNFEFLIEHVV